MISATSYNSVITVINKLIVLNKCPFNKCIKMMQQNPVRAILEITLIAFCKKMDSQSLNVIVF